MTQFDYPQGHKHKAMVSFTFKVYSEVPFSLYAGNGKCRWLVNKAEIVLQPLVSFTFGVYCGVPFCLDTGKGKCGLLIKWKYRSQNVSLTGNGPI